MSWRTKQEVKKKNWRLRRWDENLFSNKMSREIYFSVTESDIHTRTIRKMSHFSHLFHRFFFFTKKHTHTDQLDVVPRHAQIPFSLRGITLPVKWSRGMSFLHKKSIKFPNITKDGSILKKKKENLMRWHVTSEHRKLMELLSIEFLVAALSHYILLVRQNDKF